MPKKYGTHREWFDHVWFNLFDYGSAVSLYPRKLGISTSNPGVFHFSWECLKLCSPIILNMVQYISHPMLWCQLLYKNDQPSWGYWRYIYIYILAWMCIPVGKWAITMVHPQFYTWHISTQMWVVINHFTMWDAHPSASLKQGCSSPSQVNDSYFRGVNLSFSLCIYPASSQTYLGCLEQPWFN